VVFWTGPRCHISLEKQQHYQGRLLRPYLTMTCCNLPAVESRWRRRCCYYSRTKLEVGAWLLRRSRPCRSSPAVGERWRRLRPTVPESRASEAIRLPAYKYKVCNNNNKKNFLCFSSKERKEIELSLWLLINDLADRERFAKDAAFPQANFLILISLSLYI